MSDQAENLSPEEEDGVSDEGSAASEAAPLTADAATLKGPSPDAAAQVRPVPRISIDCFCDNPDTGTTVQRAADDRRLARTHTTIYMGGIDAAIDHYETRATPNLIVVETLDPKVDILDGLEKLAERCDASTKVIVIGVNNDIALYRELMKAGVSDYLITPLTPMQFMDSVSSLYVDPNAAPIGKIIVILRLAVPYTGIILSTRESAVL